MLHFEKCQQIWGGSPATEQLDGGIESKDLLEPQSEPSVVSLSTQLENEPNGESAQLSAEGKETSPSSSRRDLLDKTLKNYKQEKMKHKLLVDVQLLSCAQEELKMK